MRRLLVVLAGVVLLLGAAGFGAWRGLPDPLADAEAFLAPYDEVSVGATRPSLAGGINGGTLAREAWFAEEERRMRATLPASRGWTFARSTSPQGPTLTASASGPSRLRNLVRRVPFLPSPAVDADGLITVTLTPYRPLASFDEMVARRPEPVGWTTAQVSAQWRPYPFRRAPTQGGTLYQALTPIAPGLAPGDDLKGAKP